jgi:hypothetical protein
MLEADSVILGRVLLIEKRIEDQHGQLPFVALVKGRFGSGHYVLRDPVMTGATTTRRLQIALGMRVSCHCCDLPRQSVAGCQGPLPCSITSRCLVLILDHRILWGGGGGALMG